MERRKYFSVGRRAEIARHVGEQLVEQFDLPPRTDHDALLCALYQRAFISDRAEPDASRPASPAQAVHVGSPFGPTIGNQAS
jgi:hypothetical protein